MAKLKVEVKNARRDRETAMLVVHGFGASGVGGAIKAALSTELPRLARQHVFKAYGYADKDRIPREQNVDARSLNQGSTLLIFREAQTAKDATQDFRTNFRNLRSKVKLRARRAPSRKSLARDDGGANRFEENGVNPERISLRTACV